MTSDWIEWNGGKRPVPGYRRVQVRHRDGWEDTPQGRAANLWTWGPKTERSHNIVAYRIAEVRK